MAVHAGRHPVGTDRGRILLRTLRDGLAARAGHDLTMEATRWSGELTADDGGSPTGPEVPQTDDSGIISGSLAGRSRPARPQVSRTGADAYRATTSIEQIGFGSTPGRAFRGSLPEHDAVNVGVLPDLPDHAEAAP